MMHNGVRLQIHLDGGTPADGRSWLGEAEFHLQTDGDLGERMQSAVDLAFLEGAGRVVVIGTDCPSIDESLLGRAFDALNDTDLVYGPAADGGYYLVGLSRPSSAIFSAIEWGGPQVLAQSLAAAKDSSLHFTLLEVLSDVDLPDDLPAAFAALGKGTSLSAKCLSTYGEFQQPSVLDRLHQENPQ